MGITPKEVIGSRSPFIKSDEFKGDGLVLKVLGFKIISANNPKYGANQLDTLFKRGTLKEGETIQYTFETVEDVAQVRKFESKSASMLIGWVQCDPDEGDVVKIVKTGEKDKTRFTVTKTT